VGCSSSPHTSSSSDTMLKGLPITLVSCSKNPWNPSRSNLRDLERRSRLLDGCDP